MYKHLFFICPTDYIEPAINESFKHKNYFYSSLGNSMIFDFDTTYVIEHLIKQHGIKEVSFVLSDDNIIISDAIGEQNFFDIKGLHHFHNEIIRQKKISSVSWQKGNDRYLMLSCFLNQKIDELQIKLEGLLTEPIKISGKIYNRKEQIFTGIYFYLIRSENLNLN